jgi:hypothetical protein
MLIQNHLTECEFGLETLVSAWESVVFAGSANASVVFVVSVKKSVDFAGSAKKSVVFASFS